MLDVWISLVVGLAYYAVVGLKTCAANPWTTAAALLVAAVVLSLLRLWRAVGSLLVAAAVLWFAVYGALTAVLAAAHRSDWLSRGLGGWVSAVVFVLGALLWAAVACRSLMLAARLLRTSFMPRAARASRRG